MQMNKLTIVFSLCLLTNWVHSQILDVFQNKQYEVSTRVLSAEINKNYSPKKLEIYQDKNKVENEAWTKIEDQLFRISIEALENEVSFFKLYNEALKYQNQYIKAERLQGNEPRNAINPKFNKIEISLESMLNNIGIYTIQYNFDINSGGYHGDEKVEIKQYYLVDFDKNKITKFGDTPTLSQQELLKQITLSKFKTLYLLQTQKIDLNNLERIEEVRENKAYNSLIASKLYFSEAVVFPYLSGIIVEFPRLSNSSQIFRYESFRIFLKGEDVKELLHGFPELRPAFQQPLAKTSSSQVEQLNNDDLFNISRYRNSPKELEILEIIDFGEKVYAMKINMHQISDTVRRYMGSTKYFFDKKGKVLLVERADDHDRIRNEEKYFYNEKQQLTSIKSSSREEYLELFHYKNNILDYTENYELEVEKSYNESIVDLNVDQKHYIYSGNHRYLTNISLVGDFTSNGYTQYRYLENNQYCANSYCILTNDDGNFIGVKQKRGAPIDILTNSDNQPVESYFDNDRYLHFFTYDEQGRIIQLKNTSDASNSSFLDYEYSTDKSKALVITEQKLSYSNKTVIEYAYEFEFWKE